MTGFGCYPRLIVSSRNYTIEIVYGGCRWERNHRNRKHIDQISGKASKSSRNFVENFVENSLDEVSIGHVMVYIVPLPVGVWAITRGEEWVAYNPSGLRRIGW